MSREAFEKIRDLEISEHRISHVITRDLFLFACYTGTSYADTVSITGENIITDEEGNLWLKYRRKKNEFLARVKLLPEAITLIEQYKDENRETLFPKQHYATLRSNMKGLRIMANLSQDLVYHCFRHTFATLQLAMGTDIYTVSKMLTHKNLSTTQIYLKIVDTKKREAANKISLKPQDHN